MRGDILASGGRSAQFLPPKISQEKWDAIWKEEKSETDAIEVYRDIDNSGNFVKIKMQEESKE